MYFVYAIYNRDHDKIYIGLTSDLVERLNQHNDHFYSGSYTSRYSGEWVLLYREGCPNRQEESKREKQLKSYKGRQFIKDFIPR